MSDTKEGDAEAEGAEEENKELITEERNPYTLSAVYPSNNRKICAPVREQRRKGLEIFGKRRPDEKPLLLSSLFKMNQMTKKRNFYLVASYLGKGSVGDGGNSDLFGGGTRPKNNLRLPW